MAALPAFSISFSRAVSNKYLEINLQAEKASRLEGGSLARRTAGNKNELPEYVAGRFCGRIDLEYKESTYR
jgi:hypothetical protein